MGAIVLALLSISEVSSAPPRYEGRSWKLVFEDDFDGTSLDLSKWSYHYPWSRTHNHSAYSRSENVSLRSGRLILTARREDYGGKPYTTGVVNTSGKLNVTYGYIEARLQMPSIKGSWPAFWMLQSGWPPEIDIMEFPLSDLSQSHNEKYRYWWNYHWGTVSDHRSVGSEEWVSSDLSQGLHDYAVEWAPDSMRFFYDGAVRGEVTDRGAIAQSAGMYMVLNYAVGGWPGEPTSWPAEGDTYEIDWVRVWQLSELDDFIDLGNIVGGGDGRPASSAPYVGLHPSEGTFSNDVGLDSVTPSGPNPRPVPSALVDSVFVMASDSAAVNTQGTRFTFPSGDAVGRTWDLISNAVEADGDGRLLLARSVGMHSDDGRFLEVEIPRNARTLTLATGRAGDGNGQDHGVFADAFITPCSLADPSLCPVPADELLVVAGSDWTYLDDGPAPAAGWTERSFSTAGWRSGPAPLGYGNGGEATEVRYGNDPGLKRVTTHFRRSFPASDVEAISRLSLRLLRDDGAIVYLNGTEILRSNLPSGAVGPSTLASETIADEAEGTWVLSDVDPCLLLEGANVLAVEVHQASRTSSDVLFDLSLAAERNPGSPARCGAPFLRGDCNGDGDAEGVTDAIFVLDYSFLGGEDPPCLAACDVEGDGVVDGITDAIYLLQHNFLGGTPPPSPFPGCGLSSSPSDGTLGCLVSPAVCP